MFCQNCGAQMPEGTIYCSNCGMSMAPAAAPTPTNEQWSKEHTEYGSVYSYAGTTASTKSIDVKKMIIIAVAAILGIALLIGGIIFVTTANTPIAKLSGAANKTLNSLTDIMGGGFSSALTNGEKLFKKGEFTATIDYEYDSDYSNQKQSLTLNYDKNELSANLALAIDEENMEFDIYANKDALYASSPDLADDAYFTNLKGFGEAFKDSELYELIEDELDEELLDMLEALDIDLFADRSWKEFKTAYPDEVSDFEESLIIEKTDEEIPETNGDMTVYSVEFDSNDLVDMIIAYSKFSVEAYLGENITDSIDGFEDSIESSLYMIEDYDLNIYAGVSEGALVALHMVVDGDGDEASITLVLEGKDNPWEEFYVYMNEEKYVEGTLDSSGDGFELSIEIEDEEITIESDGSEIVFEIDNDLTYTFQYDADDNGIHLGYTIDSSYYDYYDEKHKLMYSYNIDIVPLEKVEKIEDAIDVFELSEKDIENLAEEIEENLNNLG